MTPMTGYPDLDEIAARVERLANLSGKALEEEGIALVGRKSGVIPTKLKALATLPLEERRTYGAKLNELRVRADAILVEHRKREASAGASLAAEQDLTMPGRRRWVGAEH